MSILTEAEELINGDRNESYGSAIKEFTRLADFWSTLIGKTITPETVIRCMILLKINRSQYNTSHRDSIVDIAGYAGLLKQFQEFDKGNQRVTIPGGSAA